MKPNKLRIGNYVRIKDTCEIVGVCAISKRKIGFHATGDRPNAQLRFRKLCDIEPIRIREIESSLPFIPNLMYVDKDFCEDLYYYRDLVITDLHELQNIYYALTGNEITIDL